MMRALISVALTLCAIPAAADDTVLDDDGPITCPHSQTQEVYFSSPDIPDTIHIDVIGDDCETADVAIMIQPLNANVIYAFRRPAMSLMSGEYHDEPAAQRLSREFDGLVVMETTEGYFTESGNLVEEGPELGIYDLDEQAIQKAHAQSLPVFTHTSGCMGGSRSFAFLDGQVIELSNAGPP